MNYNWSTKNWTFVSEIYTNKGCKDNLLTVVEYYKKFIDANGKSYANIDHCRSKGGHIGGNRDRLDLALDTQALFLKGSGR